MERSRTVSEGAALNNHLTQGGIAGREPQIGGGGNDPEETGGSCWLCSHARREQVSYSKYERAKRKGGSRSTEAGDLVGLALERNRSVSENVLKNPVPKTESGESGGRSSHLNFVCLRERDAGRRQDV